jgi:phage recombination protein Bet
MNNVVTLQTPTPIRPRDYSAEQMALIRRTVAADTTPDEFNMFIEVAKRAGLDPFRKQLYCVVYNKDKPDKRKVSFITGIDGFRAIAQRNGDYRPDDDEPQFVTDDSLKGASNPAGLVKAVVKAFKRYGSEWFPVVGVAYWTEFAVMTDGIEGGFRWEDTGEVWPDSGKPKKRKVPLVAGAEAVQVPAGKWADMPHVMLAKCAESQALRKGWPEDLSAVYSPEEMERPMLDVTPTDAIAQHEAEQRLQRIGGNKTVPMLWVVGEPIEAVPIGKMYDRCVQFIKAGESITQLELWRDANRVGLQQFWAAAMTDALAVKKLLEDRLAALAAE